MDEILSVWATGYAAQQAAAQGSSTGQEALSGKTIQIIIELRPSRQPDEALRLLESRAINYEAPGNTPATRGIGATVLVSLLAGLNALPSVASLSAWPMEYPHMGESVNILIAQYQAGIISTKDASSTYALMAVYIVEDDNYEVNYDNVKHFLEDNGAVIARAEVDINDFYRDREVGHVPAYVPVSLLERLANHEGVQSVLLRRFPVENPQTDPPIGEQ